MLATVPSAPSAQAGASVSNSMSSAVELLGLLPSPKGGARSASSTRATSPSSSTGDVDGKASGSDDPDSGALAQRRGRSVLMLSELVLDVGNDSGPGDSPSDESTSSMGVALGNSSRCTPSTPYMMGFSPAIQFGPAGSSFASHVAEPTLMRTSPLQKSSDASQRTAACAGRLGGAAAGGDASQRSPACAAWLTAYDTSQRNASGRVSLGVAAFNGDASQRSPPGCATRMAECSFVHMCTLPTPMQQAASPLPASGAPGSGASSQDGEPSQSSPAGSFSEGIVGTCPTVGDASQRSPLGTNSVPQGITSSCLGGASRESAPAPPVVFGDFGEGEASSRTPFAGVPQEIAGTSPVVSSQRPPSPVGDASQRNPGASVISNVTVEGGSDAVKSWLAGVSSNGFPVNDSVIAEQLRAAIPESYED